MIRDDGSLLEWANELGVTPRNLDNSQVLSGYRWFTDTDIRTGEDWLVVETPTGDIAYAYYLDGEWLEGSGVGHVTEFAGGYNIFEYADIVFPSRKRGWDPSNEEHVHFEGGGVRSSDDGKPRFEMLLVSDLPYSEQVLTRAAVRMHEGAKLYGARNFEKMTDAESFERAKASLLRHVMQYVAGETDEDHLAATVANAVMLSSIERGHRG